MKIKNRWTKLKQILYYRQLESSSSDESTAPDTSTPPDDSTPGDTSEASFKPPPTNPPFINP